MADGMFTRHALGYSDSAADFRNVRWLKCPKEPGRPAMIKSSNNGLFSIPTAPSAGVAVTQSGTPNTYGSYAQMIASTAEADYIVGIRFEATTTQVPTYVSFTIGTGAAA